MTHDLSRRLQRVLDDAAGIVVRIEQPSRGISWSASSGNVTDATPFFIASTTKPYTTAIIRRLVDSSTRRAVGVVGVDRLVDRVAPGEVDGLHVHRGVDRTASITVRHLLAHTSGLVDYFSGRNPRRGQPSLEKQLRRHIDVSWTSQDVVQGHAIARTRVRSGAAAAERSTATPTTNSWVG